MREKEEDFQKSSMSTLVNEKNNLQATVRALVQEVEELSVNNEQFLVDLKKKDFYIEYA